MAWRPERVFRGFVPSGSHRDFFLKDGVRSLVAITYYIHLSNRVITLAAVTKRTIVVTATHKRASSPMGCKTDICLSNIKIE